MQIVVRLLSLFRGCFVLLHFDSDKLDVSQVVGIQFQDFIKAISIITALFLFLDLSSYMTSLATVLGFADTRRMHASAAPTNHVVFELSRHQSDHMHVT